jgi:membrane-bound lytic murein transglycosylase D
LTEAKLVAINGLRNRNQIAVGQRLMVSTSARAHKPVQVVEEKIAAAPAAPKPVEQAALTPPAPNKTLPVEIASEAAAKDPIEIASTQSVDTLVESPVSQAPTAASVVIPAPDPSDYAVSDDNRITVQANETLGHYADWLEIPTNRLRRVNGIRYGTPVGIGRVTKLDFSVVTRETFEQRRLEYHHTLQEEFFAAYEVVGTDTHKLRKGDTLWDLAEKRFRVPVWLLRQYNPTLDFSALQAGAHLTVPRIAPRTS